MAGTRPAGKAGSWYRSDPRRLHADLEDYLAQVRDSTAAPPQLPVPGARVIIAPHAGYDYSGKCAAWAYSCLDLTGVKRVFLLGPSHTYYLDGCAVTTFAKYATPFGDFSVDVDTLAQVHDAGRMATIPKQRDQEEHSLEMHLPYLYKCCERTFESPRDYPAIVPVLVGDNTAQGEKSVGSVLAPHLSDPQTAFIVSSDFCHWGQRFQYMAYSRDKSLSTLVNLRGNDAPQDPPIHASISWLDEAAMDAVASGSHDAFFDNLKMTRNTVCGRHPIGVAMAGLETLPKTEAAKHRFKIINYDRSNLVQDARDFSVSYVSAYAVM